MINKDYLNNLNEAQKEAVLHLDGPLLIVAGAGSGIGGGAGAFTETHILILLLYFFHID